MSRHTYDLPRRKEWNCLTIRNVDVTGKANNLEPLNLSREPYYAGRPYNRVWRGL
jgi:hypothetical protein